MIMPYNPMLYLRAFGLVYAAGFATAMAMQAYAERARRQARQQT